MTPLTILTCHSWEWKTFKVGWSLKGSEIKSPISTVLIHGFGACKEHWRHNQTSLGAIAPCYAIDLIGFGESSQPNSNLLNDSQNNDGFHYCFDNWSNQIADFCNQVIKTPVLLIGNSIGGIIALKTSQLLQDNCRGVILIDCAQRQMDDKRLQEQPVITQLMRPLLKGLVRQRCLSENIFSIITQEFFIKKVLTIAYPSNQNVNQSLLDLLIKPSQRPGAKEAFRGFINLFNDYLAPDLMKDIQIFEYLS